MRMKGAFRTADLCGAVPATHNNGVGEPAVTVVAPAIGNAAGDFLRRIFSCRASRVSASANG
jgi:hypothetical protein